MPMPAFSAACKRTRMPRPRRAGATYGYSDRVHTLVTLGTPHSSIEQYPFGRAAERLAGGNVDRAPAGVRESSLAFANHFYPDAAALGGPRVVCVIGDAVRGSYDSLGSFLASQSYVVR